MQLRKCMPAIVKFVVRSHIYGTDSLNSIVRTVTWCGPMVACLIKNRAQKCGNRAQLEHCQTTNQLMHYSRSEIVLQDLLKLHVTQKFPKSTRNSE